MTESGDGPDTMNGHIGMKNDVTITIAMNVVKIGIVMSAVKRAGTIATVKNDVRIDALTTDGLTIAPITAAKMVRF